jgi:hypothetical protein
MGEYLAFPSWFFLRSRSGMLLPIVFFVLLILGLFAFQYNRMVSHTQTVSFRLEQSEIAHRLAEAAIDEAFLTVHRESANGDSPLCRWLIQRQAPDSLPVDTPLLKKVVMESGSPWFHGSLTPEVEVAIQRVDFRRQAKDRQATFYGHEGIGTLAFTAIVSLVAKSKNVGGCRLVRHHDYKVVSMVSPMETRGNAYVGSSVLDFALFVRNGYKEFLTTGGNLLKNPLFQLSVQPDPGPPMVFGNVFFNGVDFREFQHFLPDPAQHPDQIPLPAPRFFDRMGRTIDPASPRFRPFIHEDLWARTIPYKSHLKTTEILDNGQLFLNGIIRSIGSVDIDQPTVFHGQGILIADEFRIKAGLKRHGPSDLCVLYAMDGNIRIETSEEIQASLIALSNANADDRIGRIQVVRGNTLNLKGGLIADFLNLNNWPPNVPHSITYDGGFRRNQDLYQVTLSRWITYSRLLESGS